LTLRKLEQLNQKTLNAQKQIAKLQRQKNPDLKMVEILQEKVRRNISDLGESLKAVSIRIALARKTEQEFHEAKGLLVQTALRLTVNLAKRYRNKGLTFEDLIGEGHIGLMRAAEKFDPARGNQFTTYATWWIRQSIRSAITNKSALIRMPAHLQQMRQQISEIRIELTHKNNREPSLDEISKEYLGRTKAATNKPPKKSKEITESVVLLSPGIRSLDDRAPEQRYSLGDIIREQSQTFEDIIEEDHKTWLREKVNQALDSLNPRKQLVIKLRFGIGTPDNNPMTLVQIGAVLGVTKERVRQLESNAKEDLKRLALN
jgi:RNA polymerase sigma factor (sigma-70 family)